MSANVTPKCRSWLGHYFEARYSTTGAKGDMNVKGDAIAAIEIMKLTCDAIYERDVCVRCGHVIEKAKP